MRGPRVRGVGRALVGSAVAVALGLGASIAGFEPGAAEVAVTADHVDRHPSVVFACSTGPVEVAVTASVDPVRVPAGGTVAITFVVRVPASPSLTGMGALWIAQPLPAAMARATEVAVLTTEGLAATAWSIDGGALTVNLTPDADHTGGGVAATVMVLVELGRDLSPGEVVVGPPTALLVGASPGGTGPQSCPSDGPGAALATFTVVESPGEGEPPATDSPHSDDPPPPTVDPDRPPDPAAGGDAPSPPPLTEDEIPEIPPAPGRAPRSEVVDRDVDAARDHVATARRRFQGSDDRVEALRRRAGRAEAAEAVLEAERDRLAAELEHCRLDLARRAGAAYVAEVDDALRRGLGTKEAALLAGVPDQALEEYERLLARQAEVLEELRAMAADRAGRQARVDQAEARQDALGRAVTDGAFQLNTFLAGGEVAISGFHFPVGGSHDFTDTWHAPRAGGRLHEGTDVFAAEGTPLYAPERGALARVGTDALGGTKLWVVGESGTHYYYAHLSGYAPGVADGVPVESGQVIGYVGNTGNARTTPPHLHFEVHPGGGEAVNPYAMLAAADAGDPGPVVGPPSLETEPGERDGRSGNRGRGEPEEGAASANGVAVDGSGDVYVVDAAEDTVRRLDPDGEVMVEWGGTGGGEGRFHHPEGVAVGPGGSVYVADTHNNRIQKFTARGRFLAEWGRTGHRDGRFNHPAGVAVAPDGTVYVADTYNNRVQAFDPSGDHLRSWGDVGADERRFAHPHGVAVATDGDVYVADTFNGRIQHFTPGGRLVAVLEAPDAGPGGRVQPTALVVDGEGAVWVTGWAAGPVLEFDGQGDFVRAWDRKDLQDGDSQVARAARVLADR